MKTVYRIIPTGTIWYYDNPDQIHFTFGNYCSLADGVTVAEVTQNGTFTLEPLDFTEASVRERFADWYNSGVIYKLQNITKPYDIEDIIVRNLGITKAQLVDALVDEIQARLES